MSVSIFLLGCLGGLLPEVIRFTKNYNDIKNNEYLKEPLYYVNLVCLSLLGGFVVWLLNVTEYLPAVLCGFSAPEILTRLAAQKIEEFTAIEAIEEDTKIFETVESKESDETIDDKDEGSKEPTKRKKIKFNFRSWWAR